MLVEMRLTSEIKLYPGNPRVNDAAVAAVAASIREFGFRQPIVVDEDGVIIVGHTRHKAAQKLGMTEVPVHVAVGLTPAQIRAVLVPSVCLPEYTSTATAASTATTPDTRTLTPRVDEVARSAIGTWAGAGA